MPRLEKVVGRPSHTMTMAPQERIRFPTLIVYIDDVYSPVEGIQDQPFVETQSQAGSIGKLSLGNKGWSLPPYHMSSFDCIDDEYESRYLFPTSRSQANPPFCGAQACAPNGDEDDLFGNNSAGQSRAKNRGIQIGRIQAGMTHPHIES